MFFQFHLKMLFSETLVFKLILDLRDCKLMLHYLSHG